MSKKHKSKHCTMSCEVWEEGVPHLYGVNVGDLETEEFSSGLPLVILLEEADAIIMMSVIDKYMDAYITSCINKGMSFGTITDEQST